VHDAATSRKQEGKREVLKVISGYGGYGERSAAGRQMPGDVEKSDLYVGLSGFRYGYVSPLDEDNHDGRSITELDFRPAEKLKKPCLIFIAHEDAGISQKFSDASTGKGDHGRHIKRLREYLRTKKTVSFFKSPYNWPGSFSRR
jgi:hypothetical protein